MLLLPSHWPFIAAIALSASCEHHTNKINTRYHNKYAFLLIYIYNIMCSITIFRCNIYIICRYTAACEGRRHYGSTDQSSQPLQNRQVSAVPCTHDRSPRRTARPTIIIMFCEVHIGIEYQLLGYHFWRIFTLRMPCPLSCYYIALRNN